MEDSFKRLAFGIILLTAFSVLIISFIISGAGEYGLGTDDLDSNQLNFTGLNQSLQDIGTKSAIWNEQFQEHGFFVATGVLAVKETFELGKNIWSFLIIPFELVFQIMINILGAPVILAGVITGLVTLSLLFGLYRLLRIGS